jgi:integrase
LDQLGTLYGKDFCAQVETNRNRAYEFSFHSLRDTFTTWLKSAGASNALAQMIVGHDSEVVSRGHTHLDVTRQT